MTTRGVASRSGSQPGASEDRNRCLHCDRVLPPARKIPEGWWQPRKRYCDTVCREAAAQARSCEQAKTATAQDVLLSCARARIALRPDGTGGLCLDARMTGLDPLVRKGLRIHEREVT